MLLTVKQRPDSLRFFFEVVHNNDTNKFRKFIVNCCFCSPSSTFKFSGWDCSTRGLSVFCSPSGWGLSDLESRVLHIILGSGYWTEEVLWKHKNDATAVNVAGNSVVKRTGGFCFSCMARAVIPLDQFYFLWVQFFILWWDEMHVSGWLAGLSLLGLL